MIGVKKFMISIYTFTLGREFYLTRLIESIEKNRGNNNYEHYVCAQGVSLSETTKKIIKSSYNTTLIEWDVNEGIASGMNKIIPKLKGNILLKLDEDALLCSPNFFNHIEEINRLAPHLVFSPYPVGLINNPGGPRGSNHQVIHSEKLNTFYTLRLVNHIGGFARISPSKYTKNWKFEYDKSDSASGTEDAQHSSLCIKNKIPMAYLENCLIVEHQESTLGQHQRYGEKYFKGRF